MEGSALGHEGHHIGSALGHEGQKRDGKLCPRTFISFRGSLCLQRGVTAAGPVRGGRAALLGPEGDQPGEGRGLPPPLGSGGEGGSQTGEPGSGLVWGPA